MIFEWDPAKAEQNYEKHGVLFHEATTVFGDPLAMTYLDPDHSLDEERFLTIGRSRSQRLLIVAHAERHGRIRIINARETTTGERNAYEEEKPKTENDR